MGAFDLAGAIRELGDAGPRLYARWSARAWEEACAGPAARLWDAIRGQDGADTTLVDYLMLVREAVGMQSLGVASNNGENAHGTTGADRSFLAVALCDALPRLLPATPANERGRLMAQLWNVGEKLADQEVWLNRYLAARLRELDAPTNFDAFLARAVAEGVDPVPDAKWRGDVRWLVIDAAKFDAPFLPGEMHLATPSIACVHDRLRGSCHFGLLLKRESPLGLGVMPCFQSPAAPKPATVSLVRLSTSRSLPERHTHVVSPSGFIVFSSPLSQRLWVGVVDE